MNKRVKVGAALAIAAVLPLTACSTTAPGGNNSQVVELTFQQFDPATQVTGLQKAVDDFNASQSRIKVTMQNVAFADALNTFVREAGSGAGPDVLHTAFTWTADLAKNGLILNLDDYIAKNKPGAGIKDFLGLKINEYKNSIYALPFSSDSFALTYNTDSFAAAGLTKAPTTFEELQADAAKLTTGSGADKKYGFCFPMAGTPGSEIWHFANVYLWSHGASVIKNNGGKWTPGASDSQLADAISYFKSFVDKGYTPTNVLSIPLAGDAVIAGGLSKGTCAMAVQIPQQFAVSLAGNKSLLSAPLPAGPDGLQLQMGGRSLSINANSKHPKEAWEFIRYITSRKVFQNNYTNVFPAQATLLKDHTFGPALSSKPYRGYADSLVVARTYVEYAGAPAPIPAIWNALAQSFNAAFVGQVTPQQAAVQLNTKLSQLLKG